MEIITSDKAPAAIGPYSQAVKTGNFLFCCRRLVCSGRTVTDVWSVRYCNQLDVFCWHLVVHTIKQQSNIRTKNIKTSPRRIMFSVMPATKSPGAILNMRCMHGPKGGRQDAWSHRGNLVRRLLRHFVPRNDECLL